MVLRRPRALCPAESALAALWLEFACEMQEQLMPPCLSASTAPILHMTSAECKRISESRPRIVSSSMGVHHDLLGRAFADRPLTSPSRSSHLTLMRKLGVAILHVSKRLVATDLMFSFSFAGLIDGSLSSKRAPAPAANGVAIDVPLMIRELVSSRWPALGMLVPGA